MGTDAVTGESIESLEYRWSAGIFGGVLGGVAMGMVLHGGSNMMHLIGALYGQPTVAAGWVAHMIHSAVLGVLFVAVASRPPLREFTGTRFNCILLGVGYTATVGLVSVGILLPIALNVIGAQALPEPLLPLPGLLGGMLVAFSVGVAHVVYGIVLGGTYGYARERSTGLP